MPSPSVDIRDATIKEKARDLTAKARTELSSIRRYPLTVGRTAGTGRIAGVQRLPARRYLHEAAPNTAAISGEAVPAIMPKMKNSTPKTSKCRLPTAVSFSCSSILVSATSRAAASACSLLDSSSPRRLISISRPPT